MTTIATDGLTMAGDSLTTAGPTITRYAPKVVRLPDGRIFGGCGFTTSWLKFQRWMAEGGDKPTLDEDFGALVLNTDGTVDYYDKEFEPIRYLLPAAIGSGSEFAIGAMLAGKTPEEAVHIAILRDTKSGGDVIVEARPATPRKLAAA